MVDCIHTRGEQREVWRGLNLPGQIWFFWKIRYVLVQLLHTLSLSSLFWNAPSIFSNWLWRNFIIFMLIIFVNIYKSIEKDYFTIHQLFKKIYFFLTIHFIILLILWITSENSMYTYIFTIIKFDLIISK